MSASVAPRIISKADSNSVSAKVDDRFVGRSYPYCVRTTDTPYLYMYVAVKKISRLPPSKFGNVECVGVQSRRVGESQTMYLSSTSHERFLQEVIYNRKGFKFIALIVWIKCPEMCGRVSKSCRESGELPFPMKRHFQGYEAPHPLFPNSTFVASTSLLIVRAG